ncbi:hypothetical protein P168DRAFT_247938 [Aspergillus campestris IBT 28561]|uniref:Uncharacterized protein n=1 Tax=Aspergillus campestris (strain IBT 28561) TaxID=1392248 RepID=A0A2I1DHU7_ASPC2|nr:uncharacterized protein P168DRAFT_247938 [Aspergillus campestris IBT 28561]PKY09438.1 hypothetical protein P168DRAFT_247938 [Aspergillus campestris IBT 28561]
MALSFQLHIEDYQVRLYGTTIIAFTCIITFLSFGLAKYNSRIARSNPRRAKAWRQYGTRRPASSSDSEWATQRESEFYKELFFKLQNLEEFPDTIPTGREIFLLLLSQALKDHVEAPHTSSILSIKHFDEKELARSLQDHQDEVTRQYYEYISRRRSGGPRELFDNRQVAGDRLREIAPLKLVDGAWLGHFNKITMPFLLRPIMKQTWQVFTEELGNGNREQHHVKVFDELLRVFEPDLPSPTTKTILHPRYGLGNLKYWRAAAAQLLVSLFPHEFVPEILGFNMHFELLQLDTMQAAKELPEVQLNPYYFLLHVSIDNNHSGHAAMAMTSVVDYIHHLAETEGEVAAEVGWKRVQAGYVLSEWLSQKGNQATNILPQLNNDSNVRLESKVLAIFGSKTQAAHRLHCGSRVKIGGRLLTDWLNPEAFRAEEWQQEFIRCFSTCKPWICSGDSQKSRLVQELQWGGKMYGSFTKNEVETLELWIDSLTNDQLPFYYSFIGPITRSNSQKHNEPGANKRAKLVRALSGENAPMACLLPKGPLMKCTSDLTANLNLSSLLPLWFTQCCLFESFVYAPGRTTDTIGCAMIRFLRAQSGFDTDHLIVTGTDGLYTGENKGIIEFGLEITLRASLPVPHDLNSLLSRWPSEFATTMLKVASSPIRNFGLLLGMSMAFLELQDMVSEFSNPSLLCPKSRMRLGSLARKQYQCLQVCLEEIPAGDKRHVDFHYGYGIAKAEINKCFKPTE